jgi:hypothetical protein
VLHTAGDRTKYWWLYGSQNSQTLASELNAQAAKAVGKPSEAKARKAERAERDRLARAAMRGAPRNDDSNSQRKGKKK